MRRLTLGITVFGLLLAVWEARARACGCFAPPNAATPIVQAGERILFSRDKGIVTAHIQIQYAGKADDFGWLLPLPAIPVLELGSDEIFNQLGAATQPTYKVNPVYEQCFFSGGTSSNDVGCGFGGADEGDNAPFGGFPDARAADAATSGPLVVQESIGPYDYAVLKADSGAEMLAWLNENHYFVPAGIDDAVKPYIHPGAYFLALRLSAGNSAGDIQPVIVRYASDLPMIPIVLTQVGAQPDMGIQVYMLAQGRAIPRNYAHTVLNDAQLDWANGVSNYNSVVIRATKEAAGRHTFITEYAGPAAVMKGRLAPEGRFGSESEFAAATTIDAFVQLLVSRGFMSIFAAPPTPLLTILAEHAPVPPALAQMGIKRLDFYLNLARYRSTYPSAFVDWPPAPYDGPALAAEVFDRVVEPLRAAETLFEKFPTLTRLYTTLSPADMTRDPVFTENVTLPGVASVHSATLTYHCGGNGPASPFVPATLRTEQGFIIPYPNGTAAPPALTKIPSSERIEVLAEEGVPGVMRDNQASIVAALASLPQVKVTSAPADDGGGGCGVAHRGRYLGIALMGLMGLWRVAASRRRTPGR